MPKIHLKPFSAEFADEGKKMHSLRTCSMPSCMEEGAHKAPKDRSLESHHWFCFEHVQEYNRAWDFFSGMSGRDIEEHIIRSTLWDRPTRPHDGHATIEEHLHRKAWQTYHFTEEKPEKEKTAFAAGISHDTPEFQAMVIMGLEPPLDMVVIKARYKELVKKHHPDVNHNDPNAGELIKSINMAYTILKLACEKYETAYADEKK